MKKIGAISAFLLLFAVNAVVALNNPCNLLIAPVTLAENSVSLLWDKVYSTDTVRHEIFLNNKLYTTNEK
ncbi:MAG: hypothetical protein WCI49_05295 [Ferruginibacter sp.]